jgi:phosphonopyruvate decarboxylase
MIAPQRLYDFLQQKKISFYAGVPDSLLKDFLKYLQDHGDNEHTITANEGLAVALASGYYMNTGKLPLVYLQNSGLGNIINPLTSLADKEMYGIPMLLLIGWRGRPGSTDEPQHMKMGRVTTQLLQAMEIPCYELTENEDSCFAILEKAIEETNRNQSPVALLAKENLFEKYEGKIGQDKYALKREQVIRAIIERLRGDETVICTTGKTGREFNEQNIQAGKKINKYLLCVGAMGHANHLALGIAIYGTQRVVMLDGDGAILMHMGALPLIAQKAGNNFLHIVINNGSHESVGGQPTAGFDIDLCAVAKACGYTRTYLVTNEKELGSWLTNSFHNRELQFVEIRTDRASRNELGRPDGTPLEWKNIFMKSLKRTE